MRKVIAIDFDGCLCENAWPEIGKPHMEVINAAIKEQTGGSALILWTCRVGELLERSVEWCRSYGLEFDAVNENLPERLEHYGSESRKISADEYWDDCAIHMPKPPNGPLILNELREMDGEPVWCIIIDGDYKGESFWGLVSIDTAECICNNWDVIIFAYYGKTWLAYRRKPEEGQHDA